MSWTVERVNLLRKLWTDGLSASRIAGELGGGLTRNAVIGKVHRLGFADSARKRPPSEPKPKKEKPLKQPPAKSADNRFPPAPGIAKAVQALIAADPNIGAPAPAPEPIVALSPRVSLLELTLHSCRWPIWDPRDEGFKFCGAHGADMLAVPPRPYCAHHATIAYPSQSAVTVGKSKTKAARGR